MKLFSDYFVYEISDENKFTSYEQCLVSVARRETAQLYERLCSEFGISATPKISVFFYAGEIIGYSGKIHVQSAGLTFTGHENGILQFAEIYYSLPHFLAMSEWSMEDTIPHEVAHVFANNIYGKQCEHDKEWQEVMSYLDLPTKSTFLLSQVQKTTLERSKKFETYEDGLRWAKGA